MTVLYKVTGYGKASALLELEHDVPADEVAERYALVHAPVDPEHALGGYELDVAAARRVSMRLGLTDVYDWFIEPFAPAPRRGEGQNRATST